MATLTERLERDTAIVLGLSTVAGSALGGWRLAGGVLGGGVLLAISFRALKQGVAALGPPAAGAPAGRPARQPARQNGRPTVSAGRVALGLIGRYALLLVAGYVIIGRLHLHPLGVLVGVSAVVVAAMVEAVRSWR